jgi:mono/diheme cytochrome c family protein
MTEQTQPTTSTHPGSSDGLWRWLIGGLAGGGIVLGLLIAAYAVGYHRGQHHPRGAAAAGAPTATTTAATTTRTQSSTVGPVAVTPALVTRGKSLYQSDGCSACHSLTGSAGVGPSFKGLTGGTVTLTDGQSVKADDAYLEQSIVDPDARIVEGYRAGVMSAAVASYGLTGKPDEIRALVAFIKSQK